MVDEKKSKDRPSTITPEDIEKSLERSKKSIQYLEPILRNVFRKPPPKIVLD